MTSKEIKGFKASKTLSGIETWIGLPCLGSQIRFKASKTLSGIETGWDGYIERGFVPTLQSL